MAVKGARRQGYARVRDVPCVDCGSTTSEREWFGTYSKCRAAQGCNARDPELHGFGPSRRRGRVVEYEVSGRWYSLADLARNHGLTLFVVYDRLARGWNIADALLEPAAPRRGRPAARIDVDGVLVPESLLVAASRYTRTVVRYRLLHGAALHEALGYDPRPKRWANQKKCH